MLYLHLRFDLSELFVAAKCIASLLHLTKYHRGDPTKRTSKQLLIRLQDITNCLEQVQHRP